MRFLPNHQEPELSGQNNSFLGLNPQKAVLPHGVGLLGFWEFGIFEHFYPRGKEEAALLVFWSGSEVICVTEDIDV